MEERLPLNLDLQFFAKDGPGGEKTEPATPKKLSDARKKGQVSKSHELTSSFELITAFLCLKIFVNTLGNRLMNIFSFTYSREIPEFVSMNRKGVSIHSYLMLFTDVMLQIIICCLPFFLVGFLVSFIGDLIQVRWQVSYEPLKPSLSKLNPLNGFKRMFSKQALFELFKSIFKVVLIVLVAYQSIKGHEKEIFILYEIPLPNAISLIGTIIIDTGIRISVVYLIIGFLDWIFQKRKFTEEMKMTKQEVKDEYKDTEGDPEIKSRQRQKMREASQRRMMKDVPKADVVITNPTHIAIAIKYDAEKNSAPVVLAKGEDYLAAKIKDAARDAGVPVMENKPLARALYATVEIGEEIPQELYEAVAEILAIVYNKRM
jgi:flagellar biosynthetic protein FlhB